MFTSLKRIIKSSWKSMFRDGSLVAANIFILVMAISAIASLLVFQDASRFLIDSIQGKVDISVYFKFETPEEDILRVKDAVSEVPEVKGVDYVSRDKALNEFTEKHKDNPVLMESLAEVGNNPFLASLNIKAFEASQYEAIASFFDNAKFESIVEKVDYHQRRPVIERIYSLTSGLNRVGVVFSVILVLVAVLVAFNTIRLAIYNSREEIKIQRLVGASNWFIRGPFIVQGVISGFFAALICLALFAGLCWAFNSRAESLFPGLGLLGFFLGNFWIIFLVQLATGIGLGAASSFIAVRRYLKV